MDYGDSLALGHKPGGEHEKSRQGDSTGCDLGTSVVALGTTAAASVSIVAVHVVAIGWGRSTVVGVARDPTVIAQRLVPQEVGLGRVVLFSVSEESSVLSVGVSVDSADSCDVRVELGGGLVTRVCLDRKVEGLLNRPSGVGCMLEDVQTGVFRETSIRLLRWRYENSCNRNLYGATHEHGGQVVRAVVVWSCPLGLKGLLTISIDLILVNAVDVFAKNVHSSSVVANHDLESRNLVEIERTVVADEKRG